MKIINLEKNMGSFQLKIDHLDIEPGRIHGLAGHNGCGKTILLKTIMGIMEPDRGEIDLEGLDDKVKVQFSSCLLSGCVCTCVWFSKTITILLSKTLLKK